LAIPLKIVASDFYAQDSVVFSEGPLNRAVAASMALPALFQPVCSDGRVLIDGGLTNPLPFDVFGRDVDVVVAIDVSGTPVQNPDREMPSAFEALFSSAFLFERTIVREKLKSSQPDILIHAGTSQFQTLDFLKFEAIMAASGPAKDQLKRQLARVLSVPTLAEAGVVAPVAAVDGQEIPSPDGRAKPKRRTKRKLFGSVTRGGR
jgi:NTE family protein